MTMSSLSPLSMDPAPMVSLNIMTPSRTLDAIRASRRFAVHILSPTPDGAAVARWFARRHEADGKTVFHGVRAFVREAAAATATATTTAIAAPSPTTTTTEGPLIRPGDATMPPIIGGPAVLFAFLCRLPDDVPGSGIVAVRDHAVVMGEVEEVVPGAVAGPGGRVPDAFGMVYGGQRFWRVADEVEFGGS
jgi:flavin reductase (DIM6/NTAB) family NADH-FMN oxidoreductase RutF